ncbi:hypothetical protein RJ639_018569 [Escallonia herrerae]|uniref:Large ribosomal subunit protein uL29m n=1 Tax=Escallonia herrerae TaxID=1293975 RepID=A0AA89AJ69_9ASTE|nr:hypothetical protein RJ639_018569 [Escallonia herrerae]
MFLTRIFGRTLFAAAKSETSGAAAVASSTARTGYNPLEEFFEADRNPDEDKPVVYGRSWKASELRLKSWDDLHKLWYVLLKEKNMLMTQRQMLNAQNLRFPNPERIPKHISRKATSAVDRVSFVGVRFKETYGVVLLCLAALFSPYLSLLHIANDIIRDLMVTHVQVRKSMCRIKHVLTERAMEDPDPRRCAEMKRMINAL